MGEVVTFYSYKGGTGRTMSLVNLACLLADKLKYGERILLVDWDLEAPGLHRYFHGHLKPASQATGPATDNTSDAPGLIDLFVQLEKAGGEADIRRKRKPEVRAAALLDSVTLDDYILSTDIHNLDIVKAGRFDAGYGVRVNTFPWEGFYNQYPLVFRKLAEHLKKKYRYVFIDSRTGQTDTAGICTTLMPEKLVLVFTPNRQSLYGIETVLKDAVAYRRRDQDLRPLVAYPLPARVDVSLDELRTKWRFGDKSQHVEGYEPYLTRALREAYGLRHCHLKPYFDEVQIKHSSYYSFGEEIAVLNEKSQRVEDEYSLTRAYQNLLNWLEPGFLPWESPEAIHLMRSIETRAQTVPLETQALAEDLKALRELATRLDDAGDIGNTELAIRFGERFARKHLGEEHIESLAYANKISGILSANGKLNDARTLADRALKLCRQHLNEEHPETLTALGNLAATLYAQGDLAGALELQKSVLAARRRVLGDEHPDTLLAMGNLANTLKAQGDLAGALNLQQSVLAARRRLLGDEHPDTLTAMGNLANTLYSQGDLAGALDLEKSVLAALYRLLGDEHPNTLTAMGNLANTLRAQGDLAGALELEKSVLAARRRLFGDEHPDTLSAMGNLASTLYAQGDLVGSLELEKSVLTAFHRLFGEDHPDTLTAKNNLAGTLQAQGDLAGALDLQQSVLAARRRLLGEDHPDTLTAMGNLASTLKAQGNLGGALELEKSVLAVRRRTLGEDHPDTLSAMNNLALTVKAQGDLVSTLDLQKTVLAALRRLLGEDHPNTLTAMGNLASTLSVQGDLVGALELEKSVLAARRRILGEDHPDTLSAKGNLASTLQAQGDLVSALDLQKTVLAALRRLLGEDHPNTLTAMGNLASTLQAQGDLVSALNLQQSELAARRRVLGEDHPNTLTAMNNLAGTLQAQGDLASALGLQQSVLAARRRLLGEDHPDTLTAMGNLASTLKAQGNLGGALELGKSVLEARRRTLGEDHPDTLTAMGNLASTLQAMDQHKAAKALRKEVGEIRRRKSDKEKARRTGAPVRIAGIGGAGGNALKTMGQLGLRDAALIAINTDQASLDHSDAKTRLLIGNGLSAGGRPDIAELAALQCKSAIRDSLDGARLLIIVAGLGGGTGSGASPVIADIAREMGILTVAIVTSPFAFEGRRKHFADLAEGKLLRNVDSLIVIRNDDVIEKLGEEATMQAAFASVDEEIAGVVQGIVEIVSTPGLVNIDLEDLRSIFARKGHAAAATGFAEGPERASQAVSSALDIISRKQGFRLSTAAGVLVNITANSSLSLKEYKEVMETLRPHVSPAATLICGAVFDEKLKDKLRTTIIAAGMATRGFALSSAAIDIPAFLRKQAD